MRQFVPAFAVFTLTFPTFSAFAATHTYSGSGMGSAPCATTLQTCVDGAAAGDIIELATNSTIDEALTITKSLTLQGATGFTPGIGSTTNATLTITTPNGVASVSVSLVKLRLVAQVAASFTVGTGDALVVDGSTFVSGVVISSSVPLTARLSHNHGSRVTNDPVIEYTLTAPSGTSTLDIVGNELSTPVVASSYDAVSLVLVGARVLNARISENIMHDVVGCGCGGTAAIDISPTSIGATSTIDIINNTIDGLATSGRSVSVRSAPSNGPLTVNILNNILTDSSYGLQFPSASAKLVIAADYNDTYNVSNVPGGYTLGTHNITSDPKFVNLTGRDFRLQATSPALNAGFASTSPAISTTDYYGNPREMESHVDIGAIERGADLAVTASANPPSPKLGANSTVTVAVTNQGPYDATGVTLTLNLPAGLLFSAVTPQQGLCSGATTITCTVGALARNATTNVALVVTGSALGTHSVTSSVTQTLADPSAANDSVATALNVLGTADLAILSSGLDASVPVGELVSLDFTVLNLGPDTATNVVVHATANGTSSPAGTSLSSNAGLCSAGACSLGSLSAGATARVTLALTPAHQGDLLLWANVTGDQSDPSSANDTATATANALPAPDGGASVVDAGISPDAGEPTADGGLSPDGGVDTAPKGGCGCGVADAGLAGLTAVLVALVRRRRSSR